MYGKHQDEIRLKYLNKLIVNGFRLVHAHKVIYLICDYFDPKISGTEVRDVIDSAMENKEIKKFMEGKK